MQALLDTTYVDVAQISDSHSWDAAEHKYYGVAGAEQEKTGRAPYRCSMQVGFVGDFWRVGYDAVHALYETGESFNFTHPRTSAIYRVFIKHWRPVHTTAILNGVMASLELHEDNLEVAGLVVSDAGVAGAAADVDDAASAASASTGAL